MKQVDMSLSKRRKKRKSMSKQLKTPKTYKKSSYDTLFFNYKLFSKFLVIFVQI